MCSSDLLFSRIRTLENKKVNVGIRPQNVHYSFEPVEGAIEGTVYSFETIGNKSVLTAQVKDAHVRIIAPNGLVLKLDQPVYITFDISRVIVFDADTHEYIGRYDESEVMKLVNEHRGESFTRAGENHG